MHHILSQFWRNDAIRQGTRCARAELSAAHPEDQEGAHRSAVRPGAERAVDRPRGGEGLSDLRKADRPRAAFARRGEQGIHLLHEEEVSGRFLPALVCLFFAGSSFGQATFSVRVLAPETALKAAQAALAKCRASGYQATVAVV